MRIYYLLGVFLLLYSCSGSSFENENRFYNSLKSTYTLTKKFEKKIPLDTLSDGFIFSYEISQNHLKGHEELIFLNQRTNSIYFYDWEKSELDSMLSLPREGPNGVGLIKGFKKVNGDSIFVFARNHTISLINQSGEILARRKIPFYPEMPEGKRIYNPTIEIRGTSPLIFWDNKFFMCGKIDAEFDDFNDDNCFSFTVVDFDTEEAQFILPFPEIYYSGNWVGDKFRKSFTAFNEEGNEIIISYPASHHLMTYNLKTKQSEERFGASNFCKTILPMDRKFSELSSKEKGTYYIQSDSYGPIIWDPYRKVYYRIFLKGRPDADQLTGKGDIYKNMSVIILGDDFSYMGETALDGSIYENNTFFVTKDGLATFNYSAYRQDENYLSFEVFELNEL